MIVLETVHGLKQKIFVEEKLMTNWRYFSEIEMQCSHTGQCDMNPEFMEKLDTLRDLHGPLKISSGFRSVRHPIEAAKEKPGKHTKGIAADILCYGKNAHELLRNVMKMGCFHGVGLKQSGDYSTRFIHVDIDAFPTTRPWIWTY